jgi:dihydroxy-acid dehydratase
MDTEEMVRAQPMDAVVLIGGCDKTVPAQLMGAASADIPAVQLVTGPMMTGRHEGERLGACTDCRRFWAPLSRRQDRRAGEIDVVEGKLATTAGTCAVMGTASTMACIAEALGMSLPGTAAIPAVHADRLRAAEASGAAAVRLIQAHPPEPGHHARVGGQRAARAAGARRLHQRHRPPHRHGRAAGHPGLDLQRLNELSETTPVLVDLKPTGDNYMEDFYAAGGMSAAAARVEAAAAPGHPDVTGETLGERLAAEEGLGRPPGHAARATRSSRSAGWSRCSARSRRAAPSSSARRRRRRTCSRRKAARWSSPRSRT